MTELLAALIAPLIGAALMAMGCHLVATEPATAADIAGGLLALCGGLIACL